MHVYEKRKKAKKKITIYNYTSIKRSTSIMGLQCTVRHRKKLPPPPILPRLPPRFYGFLPDKKNLHESFPWEKKYKTDDLTKLSMVNGFTKIYGNEKDSKKPKSQLK